MGNVAYLRHIHVFFVCEQPSAKRFFGAFEKLQEQSVPSLEVVHYAFPDFFDSRGGDNSDLLGLDLGRGFP